MLLKKKKKQIHEILQFLSMSFHVLKSLHDNFLSIVNVDVTILFCYVCITFLFLCSCHYLFVIIFL